MPIAIEYEDDDHATVTIDDRAFEMTRHEGEFRAWGTPEAFFMSDDLVSVIRHLVDYWYIFTSPDTAPSEGHGHGERPPGGVVSGYPMAGGEDAYASKKDREKGDAKKRGTGRGRKR
jgi:hypothetical protein